MELQTLDGDLLSARLVHSQKTDRCRVLLTDAHGEGRGALDGEAILRSGRICDADGPAGRVSFGPVEVARLKHLVRGDLPTQRPRTRWENPAAPERRP